MTVSEIDSFYFKFKNLLLSEKNATLVLKSKEGRAQVTLSVDLGHLHLGAVPQQQQHLKGRNGPARRRRRERRAEARRNAVAEEASDNTDEVCDEVKSIATQTTERVVIGNTQETDTRDIAEDVVVSATEKVADELCSDQEYSGPFKDVESEDTISYEIECWDPGN